jgi:5-methylcytosine-specific restriction endonuclease McrA
MTLRASHYRKTEDVKGKANYLLNPLNTNSILSAKHYIIPKQLTNIHAFSRDYMKLIDFNTKNNLLARGKSSSYKDKLLRYQNGLCDICKLTITEEHFVSGAIHIHHVKPIFKGGSRSSLSNMKVVHSWCHRTINH